MAECNKRLYRSSGCDDIEKGDGSVTFEQCGDRLGSITMDQCHDSTIDIPCPCDGKLKFTVDGKPGFEFTANQCSDTNYNLDTSQLGGGGGGGDIDWSQFPICDDCFKWCGSDGTPATFAPPREFKGFGVAPAPKSPIRTARALQVRKLKLIKFWSSSCGICHRMSHYDSKVAKELGIEFIAIHKDEDDLWDEWVHVAEPLYDDTDGMGWPTYILVNHYDKDNFTTIGEVLGGSDKGKFRRKIQQLLEPSPAPEQPVERDTDDQYGYGGKIDTHCETFDGNCSPFRWDCTSDNGEICAGSKGVVDLKSTTHGCDGRCDENGGGTQLEYKWQWSKDQDGQYRDIAGASENGTYSFKLKDIGKEDAAAGEVYWIRAVATCKDHPDDPKRLEGGGGGQGGRSIKVTIIDCCGGDAICKEDRYCCNSVDHPDQPEGCNKCCRNNHCPDGQECKNGRCKEEELPHECETNGDCPRCEVCEAGSGGVKKCKPKECPDGEVCCGAGNCQECCDDSNCPGDKVCTNGKCEDPPLEHECDSNADCGPCKDCEAGSGGVRKCKNRDCPEGQKCCADIDGCRECCDDNDCPGDQECKNGKCQDPPLDHECDTNEDCPGTCDKCVEGSGGLRRCRAECPEGQKCCDGVGCRECCRNNDCEPGQECNDNYKCVDKEVEPECRNDSDCVDPSLCCSNGKCVDCVVEKECTGNLECIGRPDGKECCDQGTNKCIQCPDPENECRTSQDCIGDDLCCKNGKCVDCCEGVNCDASKCTECKNGQCVNKCTGGQVCDGNGNCVDPKPECPRDFEVTFTCPTRDGEAGSTVQLTSSTNKGDTNVDYEWYIGGLDSDQKVSEDKSYTYTYPAAGTCERLYAYANYNDPDCPDQDWVFCDLCGTGGGGPTPTPDCTSDDDCPDGECCQGDGTCGDCPTPTPDCTSDDDCPEGQCCQGDGTCGACPPGPTPPPSGGDCNDGQCKNSWWIDWDCVASKMNARNQNYVFHLERRIALLESKLRKS